KANWVATIRVTTAPSGPTRVPRLLSTNSPSRWIVVGSIVSTLLGGCSSIVALEKTMTAMMIALAAATTALHLSSVLRMPRSSIAMGSPHGPARDEHPEIDGEPTDQHDPDGDAGQGERAAGDLLEDALEIGLPHRIGNVLRTVRCRR